MVSGAASHVADSHTTAARRSRTTFCFGCPLRHAEVAESVSLTLEIQHLELGTRLGLLG
jgi:hypothetical protein